jgi:hypothetical protein
MPKRIARVWFAHPHLHHRTYALIHLLALAVAILYHGAAVVFHTTEDRRDYE